MEDVVIVAAGRTAVGKFGGTLAKIPAVDLGAHVRLVPAPRLYHAAGADLPERFTRDVEAAVADLRRHGIKPAALIVDTLFTSDGILPGPQGFLKGAVDAIKRLTSRSLATVAHERRWTVTPLPRVMNPTIGSPGIGWQHLAKRHSRSPTPLTRTAPVRSSFWGGACVGSVLWTSSTTPSFITTCCGPIAP